MTWFDTIKGPQKPRKPKKKPPHNIFEGEKMPDEERIDQQKEEGRKGLPFKRTGLPGKNETERLEFIEENLKEDSRHHNPKQVTPELGGQQRTGTVYGKPAGRSRMSQPKSRCAMCGKKISKTSAWKRGDPMQVLPTTQGTQRMRYCYKCMKELDGPKGFSREDI
tara:strand:- start:2360 stop:2854 length:495 start_codon:yes stop_codon:yes gene_type:complete